MLAGGISALAWNAGVLICEMHANYATLGSKPCQRTMSCDCPSKEGGLPGFSVFQYRSLQGPSRLPK